MAAADEQCGRFAHRRTVPKLRDSVRREEDGVEGASQVVAQHAEKHVPPAIHFGAVKVDRGRLSRAARLLL